MPPLYDDTGPPLLLCGYASVFGVTYRNGEHLERVAAGAFQFPGSVRLDFDHRGRSLASTYGGSLKLWMDDHGLAFEAALRPEWNTVGLMRGVRSGTFRAASFMNLGDGKVTFDVVEEGDQLVNVITRISVAEVSVATSGSNPAACAWLGDEGVDELPPFIASSRARWQVGRQARYLSAHRVKAQGRGKPQAPASVGRVLALAARVRR